ncbi:MAG: TolC family protein [Mesorhizobium sp.]|nr:TolC family protein [Mesorhizobium sp.]MBL8579879.1 TolC family protein [Mesorhizobium sp.]
MQRVLIHIAIALSLALAGCASNAVNMTSAGPDTPWKPNGREGGMWSMKRASSDAGASKTVGGSDFGVPENSALAIMPETPGIDPNRRYGLPELIDIAQRNNPATRSAWHQARQAALAVGMVEATYLPVITASVIGGQQTVRTPLPVPIGTERYFDTKLGGVNSALALQWLVFDFGQRTAAADVAKQTAFAANVLFNGAHQKLIFDVTQAYYAYGASIENLRIAEEALRNSRDMAAAAAARNAIGLATTIEVAQTRQFVAQSELRRVQAEGQKRDGYQNLIAAMGVNATLRINVQNANRRPLPSASKVPLESIIKLALARRPDVVASYAAVSASKAGVKVAQAEFMPKVFVAGAVGSGHGDFNANNLPVISQQASGAGVLVGAAMPIFDGGLKSAQLAQAKSRVEAAESTFHRTQSIAVTEIVAASNALRTALESYRAAEALHQAATTTYDAAVDAYANGVGTVTAATAAGSGLLDAKQAKADSHAAALIAAANLAFVVGGLTSANVAP